MIERFLCQLGWHKMRHAFAGNPANGIGATVAIYHCVRRGCNLQPRLMGTQE